MSSSFDSPRNPRDGHLPVDQVKLRRDTQPSTLYRGVFREAWELVKSKPVETLVLSFLYLVFTGGAGGCNSPDFGGSGGTGSEQPPVDPQQIQEFFTSLEFVEWAFIAGLLAFGAIMAVVVFIVGTLVRGGANIYWLRLVRGQNAQFGDTIAVASFFLPLLIVTVVAAVGIGFGFVLLIVPGIILALGWFFVTQIVVDKNVGYVDALRASWRLTKGYKWDLLVFAILCALLNFVGVLACGVGIIVTNAVVMGAVVIVYDRIAEPGNAYLREGEPPRGSVPA